MNFPVRLAASGPPVGIGTVGYFWTVGADGQSVALVPPPEVSAGVVTFNERDGTVVPQEGDYDADIVDFFPATPVNWGPTPPVNVAAALDALSAVNNLQQQAAGSLGPLLTITFTTSAVTPHRSGTYLVLAYISGTANGQTTEALELLADASSIAQMSAATGNANKFNGTLIGFASLNPATTHTFTVRATAGTGTNTSASGEVRIVLLEIGG